MWIEQKQIDIELSELAHCYSIRNIVKNGCILIRFAQEFCLKTFNLDFIFHTISNFFVLALFWLHIIFISLRICWSICSSLYLSLSVCVCVCLCHFHSTMCCHTALTCTFYHYSCFTLDNNFELSCTFKHISSYKVFNSFYLICSLRNVNSCICWYQACHDVKLRICEFVNWLWPLRLHISALVHTYNICIIYTIHYSLFAFSFPCAPPIHASLPFAI